MADDVELNPCQMGECPSGDPHCLGCEDPVFDVIEIVVSGHTIERDDEGIWTFTPSPAGYGYDSPEEMEKVEGFRPQPMSLEDAGFAHAPEMGEIMQALCERIEKLGGCNAN